MKKPALLLITLFSICMVSSVHAQQADVTGSADFTFLSNYIWRGFDVYHGHSAFQLGADIDLFQSGFGTDVRWTRPGGGGLENAEEIDFGLYYKNSCARGEAYATDYQVGWVYYGYPDEPRSGSSTSTAADMQEFNLTLAWPQAVPSGLVPRYTIVWMWPSEGKSLRNENGGWMHLLGVIYPWTVTNLAPEIPEQVFYLSADLVYNDGAAPGAVDGSNIDHDWSHFLFGIITDFDLGSDLTCSPSVYYQASMDDSVNGEDEFWMGLKLAYAF